MVWSFAEVVLLRFSDGRLLDEVRDADSRCANTTDMLSSGANSVSGRVGRLSLLDEACLECLALSVFSTTSRRCSLLDLDTVASTTSVSGSVLAPYTKSSVRCWLLVLLALLFKAVRLELGLCDVGLRFASPVLELLVRVLFLAAAEAALGLTTFCRSVTGRSKYAALLRRTSSTSGFSGFLTSPSSAAFLLFGRLTALLDLCALDVLLLDPCLLRLPTTEVAILPM
jgi:hypothetical protein